MDEAKIVEQVIQVLKQHVGEKVFIKFLNGDKVKYVEGVVSNKCDGTHIELWEAFDNALVTTVIPLSTISLIARSNFWWKEYKPGSDEVFYGNEEEIQSEIASIFGKKR